MPYAKISELPPPVKDNLPAAAQEIFLEAFNSAMKAANATDLGATKIAWAAVKTKFRKNLKTDAWEKLQESVLNASYEDAVHSDLADLLEAQLTQAERDSLHPMAFVFSDERAFPVQTALEIDNAVHSWGRYKGKHTFDEFKANLTAMAKRNGWEQHLPQSWQKVQEAASKGECGGTCRMTSDKPDLTETVTVNSGWDGCPSDVVHGPGDEPVTLLAAGPSKGHDYAYSQNAIRESAGSRLFDATPVFLNHESASSARDRVHRPVEEMAGYITRTWPSADGNRLDGVLHVSNGLPSGKLLESALSDPVVRAHLGLSITAYRGRMGTGTFGGKVYRTVESIRARDSVDVVPDPAAGGAFNRILESAGKPKGEQMPTEQELADQLAKDKLLESTKSENDRLKADLRESKIRSLLDLSKIPEAQRKTAEEKILGDLKSRTDLADDKLQEAVAARIAAEIDYLGLAKPKVNMPGNLGGGDTKAKTLREQLDTRQVS